jgi:hypothetical protein
MTLDDLDRVLFGTFVILGLACLIGAVNWRQRRHNKRINLPPPSVACRRNGPEAAP